MRIYSPAAYARRTPCAVHTHTHTTLPHTHLTPVAGNWSKCAGAKGACGPVHRLQPTATDVLISTTCTAHRAKSPVQHGRRVRAFVAASSWPRPRAQGLPGGQHAAYVVIFVAEIARAANSLFAPSFSARAAHQEANVDAVGVPRSTAAREPHRVPRDSAT